MNHQPVKPAITIDDLEKIDIRLGTITNAVDVPESAKLIRMEVDFGSFQRVIFSGMRPARTDTASLIGKQALFTVNLEPRRMMGEKSEGMIMHIDDTVAAMPALAVPEFPLENGAIAE